MRGSIEISHNSLSIIFFLFTAWFKLNEAQTNVLITAAADREDIDLQNDPFPQAQVWISLVPKSQYSRQKRDADTNYIKTPNIPNNVNQMVMNVILDDDNDNPPEFEKDAVIVGYPGPKVTKNVAPPYLIQVKVFIKSLIMILSLK